MLILIGFSILLIFNSYYRMILYINAYTFTILRLQVTLFLLLELIYFVILINNIVKNDYLNKFKLYSRLALIFYILNLYLCNELFINLINNLIK